MTAGDVVCFATPLLKRVIIKRPEFEALIHNRVEDLAIVRPHAQPVRRVTPVGHFQELLGSAAFDRDSIQGFGGGLL